MAEKAVDAAAPEDASAFAADLADAWEGRAADYIIAAALNGPFKQRIALVSSFGAESAVLLHMAAQIDRAAPVVFIDTDRHFAQTLQYRDDLVEALDLTNVTVIAPDPQEAAREDAKGDLWRVDPDACCDLRKVRPLSAALTGFDAWFTGRKRWHGGGRSKLAVVEHDGAHFKVNPLVRYRPEDISEYFIQHGLPEHPLVAMGYPSIGCWPCTQPAVREAGRAGRWAGQDKTECGIHTPAAPARQHAF
ncbi:MAG: phosphoadenylyl-sulfate reductase [Alphaproteobacteria bacterium]|nr:phosphoadenylyl-sulfate reductase [Alphaproteobacteria bacterium]